MIDLFEAKSVFLVGGPGGVGKTTLAASLAVQLARKGHRTVVLTVDPAKRLAQALGFEDFKTDLQRVVIPGSPESSLYASMLDTQLYFDKVIERFATSPEQKTKILNNPLYRIMVNHLGGSHEYAAMERLLEFSGDSRFDKIVVDTPPTQNAIDLLNAPQRLADFMDNSVLKWFQGPKPVYLGFFRQGTRLAMKLIRRVFGADFLDRFAQTMIDLDGMQAGFRRRNLEVLDLMRSRETAFLLVTFPSEVRYLESVAFAHTLQEMQITLSGLLLNRIEPHCPERLEGPTGLDLGEHQKVDALLGYYSAINAQQNHWVQKLHQALPSVRVFPIPKQGGDIHDVESLSHLGRFLISLEGETETSSRRASPSPAPHTT